MSSEKSHYKEMHNQVEAAIEKAYGKGFAYTLFVADHVKGRDIVATNLSDKNLIDFASRILNKLMEERDKEDKECKESSKTTK